MANPEPKSNPDPKSDEAYQAWAKQKREAAQNPEMNPMNAPTDEQLGISKESYYDPLFGRIPGQGMGQEEYNKVFDVVPQKHEPTALELLQKQQQEQFQQFQKDRPGIEQSLGDIAAQGTRAGLAESIHNTRQGASNRGLLYSGQRMAGESAARAGAGMQLAQQKKQIGQQVQGMSDSLQAGAIGAGLNIQQAKQTMADTAYQQALQNYSNKQQQGAGIGGLIGAGVGALL